MNNTIVAHPSTHADLIARRTALQLRGRERLAHSQHCYSEAVRAYERGEGENAVLWRIAFQATQYELTGILAELAEIRDALAETEVA